VNVENRGHLSSRRQRRKKEKKVRGKRERGGKEYGGTLNRAYEREKDDRSDGFPRTSCLISRDEGGKEKTILTGKGEGGRTATALIIDYLIITFYKRKGGRRKKKAPGLGGAARKIKPSRERG